MNRIKIVLLALALALVGLLGVGAQANAADSPQACTITTGPNSYGNAILVDSATHLIDAEYWIQVSSGPGCTRMTRTVGNLFFNKADGFTPVNGGASGRPNIFRNGTLISDTPPINFGSSGTDGQYFFQGNWIAAPNGSYHTAGIYIINLTSGGKTYWLYRAWASNVSYRAPG